MRTQKVLAIFVLLGLIFTPLSGTTGIQNAMAEQANPPTVSNEGELNTDASEGGVIQQIHKHPTNETDPNQDVNQDSRLVEVTVPASIPPAEGSATAAGSYQERPEMSYTIEQSINLASGPDVLLLEADDDTISASPILTLLQAYGDLGAVDMFDAQTATPTLGQLLPYYVVVTWSNFYYIDPTAIGNVLANFVDAGGKVVNLNASMGTHGFQMQGRFMTENYTAMNGTDRTFVTACLGSYNPTHPVMSGVTDVCDTLRITGTYLTTGSSAIANYDDGLLFVAAKNNRTVVSINGFVGSSFQWTGQMPDLLHNAILFRTYQM